MMLSQNKAYEINLAKSPCGKNYLWLGILLFMLFPLTAVYAEVSPELLEKSKSICNKVTACYEGIKTAKSPEKLKCEVFKEECEKLLNLKMLPLVSEEYKQSISAPAWPGVWETGVDATINWGNGKIYFFKKSQYLRFDIASNKVDSGYPKEINSSTWPGLWIDGVDAAVNWGNGKAFFFKKNQYIQYDIAEDRSDSGYPKIVDGNSWPGIWNNGFDTVTNWGNGKAYFFKGNQYVSFDIDEKLSDPEYPKKINYTSGVLWSGMTDDVSKNTHGEDPSKSTISNNYLGCYKEKGFDEKAVPSMENRDINKHNFKSNKMTIGLCTTSCADKGFDYAATQYGNQCFCGSSYGKHGEADNCNMPCAGNKNEKCGGAWANSVYALAGQTESDKNSTSKYSNTQLVTITKEKEQTNYPPVTVRNGSDSLILEKSIYEPNETIQLLFTASPQYPIKSWVGMFKSSLAHGKVAEINKKELAYKYLEGKGKGTFEFAAPETEGDYDFRILEKSNGLEVATIKFSVRVNREAAGLELNKTIYEPAETIKLHFTASPQYPIKSWVGMFKASLAHGKVAEINKKELAYKYLEGKGKGTFEFAAPETEGDYDFRILEKSNGLEVATINFKVRKLIPNIKNTPNTSSKPQKPSTLKSGLIKGSASESTQELPAKIISQSAQKLFDGELGKQWNELAAFGGDFKKFARIEDKVLVVNVPKGNGWGKTGIRSAEPLIKIPEKEEKSSTKLSFVIDPVRSSDLILAIIPSNWDGNLEWRSHQIRVGLLRDLENNNSSLTLWIKGHEVMKTNIESGSLEQIGIILRPDRLVLVTDGSDTILLEGYLPENLPIFKKGYRISVLAHAPKKDMAAKLALKEIVLEQSPYKRIADLSVLQETQQKITLFDGKLMGQRWKPYLSAKVKFNDIAKISNGALNVDVPDKVGPANAGIQSSKPVIWLDQFGKDSKREVVFDFLPNETTGFAIVLSNKGNHFIVKWVKDPVTDSALLQIYIGTNLGLIDNWNAKFTPVWEQKVTTQAPSQVKLTLTPQGIRLSGNNLPEHLQAWKFLKANTGYQIYAFSFPLLPDQAVKMALKEITLNLTKLVPLAQIELAENVAPLPVKTFFDGSKAQDWELTPWRIKKDAVDPCHLDEKGFSVFDVPEGTSSDGCDIHTAEPIITIDERIDKTAYKITAEFDAKTTKNFQVVMTPHSRGNWNRYYKACYVQLFQNKQAENIFSLNCGGNKSYWKRQVSAEWLASEWDGKLTVTIEKGWLQAQLGNGQTIRIAHTSPAKLYIYVVALDSRYAATKTAFMLKKLTGQWQYPEGMKSVDRWFYIDKVDFDPEQFINDLANDLPYPNAPTHEGDVDEK